VPANEEKKTEENFSASGGDPQSWDHSHRQIPIESVRVFQEPREKAKHSFSDEELVNLTLAIITINGWNRLAITFRMVPGEYQPGRK